MAKLTKDKLKQILTNQLKLEEPEFRLEKAGSRLVGNVISATFKGKRDHERQRMIWDALTAELGPEAVLRVGMLLAFTPDEWNLDAGTEKANVRKAG
jgi:acid stress-induced BolA-like protein IbaG/YrbA